VSGRSVVAVVLPSFRVTLVRARSPDLQPEEPLCVVVDEERDDRHLSGGTRIDDASPEARAWGVLSGDTVASAKAKCGDVRVRVLRPREATCALECLAEMLLAFGAVTSPLLDRDAVLVDVTGCSHLHGGDANLLAAIESAVMRAGFSCRAVLAAGPEIAWALAYAGRKGVVRPEETQRALGELPIDVLRLEPQTTSYFHKLGISTLAQLRALPRSSLTSRADCKNLLPRVRALLDGMDDTPITRYSPEVVLEERAELEWGIEQHEALFFVLRPLCDRLSARLEGRAMLASRLEVVLELDPAMSKDGPRSIRVSLPLASPLRKSAEIFVVLRTRFEREPPLAAPVLAVVLRAPELATVHAHTRHLFEPESRAELVLPKLVAELDALLGEGAVGRLSIEDDWRFDHRSVLFPFSVPIEQTALSHAPEPMRFVPPECHETLETLEPVVRQEYIVWWRSPQASHTNDWKLVWTGDAIAFVEERNLVRGYLD
jgi:protein ImuB